MMAGFIFLGIAYGVYMRSCGFSPIYPILMAVTIFAGSMEFVTVGLLLSNFNPIYALFLTIMVNGRHVFYGISMLDKYRGTGKKKWFLIAGMIDESFSVNYMADVPAGIDKGWFMFFVTIYNYIYWVVSTAVGALFGSLLTFNMEGLDFVMTALFLVIFISQWQNESSHESSLLGLGISLLSLTMFGEKYFLLPAMAGIWVILTFRRKQLERKVRTQ
nr:AzlC family ABC transporter permease [Clostridium beijerinckii]